MAQKANTPSAIAKGYEQYVVTDDEDIYIGEIAKKLKDLIGAIKDLDDAFSDAFAFVDDSGSQHPMTTTAAKERPMPFQPPCLAVSKTILTLTIAPPLTPILQIRWQRRKWGCLCNVQGTAILQSRY